MMEQFQRETAIAAILCFFLLGCFFFAGIAPIEKVATATEKNQKKAVQYENQKGTCEPDCFSIRR